MGKYFGTDGVRGRANVTLTLEMAVRIGAFVGYYYGKNRHAQIVIGKDTRLSSDMFEMALAAGASSAGANVKLIGVCPTPAVSYLTHTHKMDCGIMVSASHNPFYDNGIKIFNSEGKKLDPAIELEIEAYMDGFEDIELAINEAIGTIHSWHDGLEEYEADLKKIVNVDLTGMNIALDLANGSATSCALETLRSLGANCTVIANEPNGININTNCGSTHPQNLQKMMAEGNFHVGFAFDGDADRLIAVDTNGDLVNGDSILYIFGTFLKEKGKLKDNVVVTTVMANLGLYKAFDRARIEYKQTSVGDKYVFECMDTNRYIIGGEQSGHIIFLEHANTGDGLLTALKLLEVMVEKKQSLGEIAADFTEFPQLLINTPVQDKNKALENAELIAMIQEIEQQLGDEGRILVRPSGTEPLVRVMVEAKTAAICEMYVNQVVDFVKMKGL